MLPESIFRNVLTCALLWCLIETVVLKKRKGYMYGNFKKFARMDESEKTEYLGSIRNYVEREIYDKSHDLAHMEDIERLMGLYKIRGYVEADMKFWDRFAEESEF